MISGWAGGEGGSGSAGAGRQAGALSRCASAAHARRRHVGRERAFPSARTPVHRGLAPLLVRASDRPPRSSTACGRAEHNIGEQAAWARPFSNAPWRSLSLAPAALLSPPSSLALHLSPSTALVEALMGFQFNHVGGGTKTRRPITLHMKYNSACVQPVCFLVTEDAGEAELSLEELQVKAELEREGREREKPAAPLPRAVSSSLFVNTPHALFLSPSLLLLPTLIRSTSSWRTRAWSGTNSSGPRRSWCGWSTSTAPT